MPGFFKKDEVVKLTCLTVAGNPLQYYYPASPTDRNLTGLEMSKEQFVNRLLSMESHVDSQHIRTGNMSDMDWENLIESADVIGSSKLIIDDTPSISIQELI